MLFYLDIALNVLQDIITIYHQKNVLIAWIIASLAQIRR